MYHYKRKKLEKFPKDAINLNEWINIIQDFDHEFKYKSTNSVICNDHFVETDFTLNIAGTKPTLKKTSVPSIFPACVTLGIDLNSDDVSEQHLVVSAISDNSPGTDLLASMNDIEVIDLNVVDIIEKTGSPCVASMNDIKVIDSNIDEKENVFFGDFKSESEITTSNSRRKYWISSQNKELVEHLKDKNKISDNCFTMLKETVPNVEFQILMRQLKMKTSRTIDIKFLFSCSLRNSDILKIEDDALSSSNSVTRDLPKIEVFKNDPASIPFVISDEVLHNYMSLGLCQPKAHDLLNNTFPKTYEKVAAITNLEDTKLTLVQSLEIMKNIISELTNIQGDKGTIIKTKITQLHQKNKGFQVMEQIGLIISGNNEMQLPENFNPCSVANMKILDTIISSIENRFSESRNILKDFVLLSPERLKFIKNENDLSNDAFKSISNWISINITQLKIKYVKFTFSKSLDKLLNGININMKYQNHDKQTSEFNSENDSEISENDVKTSENKITRLPILKVLSSYDLQHANLFKTYRALGTIPVSSASAERNFSKVNSKLI
ncbi:hypothetical protein QTP88_023877 [Uroleucon formosanum]